MINSAEKKWKVFSIDSLFKIKKVYGKPIENYQKGEIPYISTSSTNNGLIDFITGDNNSISKKHCISVDPIKGTAFWQPFDFVGRGFSGASINILYNDKVSNKYIGLFICKSIENTSNYKSSYGYLFNGNRLSKGKILLPINDSGDPDYIFMENYMRRVEKEIVDKQIDYINKQLNKLGNINPVKALNECHWKKFNVKDIFEMVQRGKRLKTADHISGKIPYVSSTALNNGVDGFIGNEDNVRKFKDCLSLANSGSVGSCFYEPFEFIASDHITHLKNRSFNKYHYLFMATMLNRLSDKYNFNREINDARISKEIILLPIKDDNTPDYDYMEQYTKNIMIDKYNRLLDFINR